MRNGLGFLFSSIRGKIVLSFFLCVVLPVALRGKGLSWHRAFKSKSLANRRRGLPGFLAIIRRERRFDAATGNRISPVFVRGIKYFFARPY
jgi:hypothetical protein